MEWLEIMSKCKVIIDNCFLPKSFGVSVEIGEYSGQNLTQILPNSDTLITYKH